MRDRAWLVVVSVALGIAAGGCGSDGESGGGSSSDGKSATAVKVSETDFKIDPANPRIDKAGDVTFKVSNDGKVPHALEVEGPDGEVETDTIEPGQSATLRADLSKPGRYTWYCPVGDHRAKGMEGEIRVAGGGKAEDDSGGGGSYGY